MNEWVVVSEYLHSGLRKRILFLHEYPREATDNELSNLKNAIEIYKKNCIVSANSLEELFKNLLNKVRPNLAEETLEGIKGELLKVTIQRRQDE